MSYLPFKLVNLNGKEMFVDVLSRPLGFVHSVQAITVDPSDVPHLLEQAHDNAGHLNFTSTLNTLRQNFTWPNMAKDVETYVRSCLACQRNNAARPGRVAPLQSLTPSARCFGDRVYLDLVDMPKSNEGHVAICTLVDAATGLTILRPVFDKTSKGVSETILESFVPYFGCPAVLVTYKVRENVNSEIKELTTTLNIKHVVSSTHHSQSNGLVERRQQMISNFMCKMCENLPSQRNWHFKVPNLQTIINSSVSSSRGFSPFFLTFFRHANFPFKQIQHEPIKYNESSPVAAQFNLAQDTIQQCQETLDNSFSKAKSQFDKQLVQKPFQPGDTIFVETTQGGLMHKKFADRYKGPYKVLEILENNNLKLIPLNNGPPISTHVNNCKLGVVRPARLEAHDTSITTPTPSASPQHMLDPFRFSLPNDSLEAFLEDEDDDLLPAPTAPIAPPAQPNVPPARTPVRTPVRPAPAPPSPSFHTPETSPTGARKEPTRPLSPAASSPNIASVVPTNPANLPRAASTSCLTRATANPDNVLEYVYDQLPLERRLAKLFKKKQQPPKK